MSDLNEKSSNEENKTQKEKNKKETKNGKNNIEKGRTEKIVAINNIKTKYKKEGNE